MPFSTPFARSYTEVSVRQHAPAASGVYGISNSTEWLFIGESDNIQQSLLKHVADRDGALAERTPSGFVFEQCDREGRIARQDRLVLEYEPRCNRSSKHRW